MHKDWPAMANELSAAIKEVRQVGLIAGIEVCSGDLVGPRICMAAREYGLLTRPVLNTLVLMPPLCATEEEMQRMVSALRLALDSVL